MSYLKALQYLESFINYERYSKYSYKEALSLERVQVFLDSIHNPESFLSSIHIAGTKGKGSTTAFIAYILREAGFKVGLYTSPHLADFRERIRILHPETKSQKPKIDFEGVIPKRKFADLIFRLKPAIDNFNRLSKYGALTFFEVCTVIAFVYFEEENVDFAVLETGLGGKLDATNVANPLVSVITPISYEHMDKLGRTLSKIASEKAGIIKNDAVVISAPQQKEAMNVIRAKCKGERAKLFVAGRDIKYGGVENNFKVATPWGAYRNLKIKLIGEHQVMNAAVALAAVESLRQHNIKISIDSLRSGLYNTLWPGRCEVVAKNPRVVLDGAQNAASAGVLKKAIKEKFRYRRLILILGVSNDKDIKGITAELFNLTDVAILTKANSPRATSPNILKKYFQGKKINITNSVKEARKLALRLAQKRDLILVTGSLFVVGEFRNDKI